jgi:hypothetical protein
MIHIAQSWRRLNGRWPSLWREANDDLFALLQAGSEREDPCPCVILPALYVDSVRKSCAANKFNDFPCTPTGKSLVVGAGERKWVRRSAELPVPNEASL